MIALKSHVYDFGIDIDLQESYVTEIQQIILKIPKIFSYVT